MKVCAITGHRPSRFSFRYNENDIICKNLKEKIKKQLQSLYHQGIHTFWLGGAEGADMWTAEILLQLKNYASYSDIKIMIAIPFQQYNEKWSEQSRKRLNNIIEHSDKVVVVSSKEDENKYRKRNQYIVERADCLLAILNGENSIIRSGTSMTIRIALKKRIPIIKIYS